MLTIRNQHAEELRHGEGFVSPARRAPPRRDIPAVVLVSFPTLW
jgi:hypothetical protein